MTNDFRTSTDTAAPSEATGGQANLDTAKIRASMQGPVEQPDDVQPNNRETPENIDRADKVRAEMEAVLQAAREQQKSDRIEMRKEAQPYDERMLMHEQDRIRDTVNGKVPITNEGESVAKVDDHWEDRGIVDVPVADLPQPEGVNGPQDFDHHISYSDAVRANEQLQTMKPQIDSGYKSDDFADLDKKNGLDYANGQQRVYDLYYGSDPVTLDKDGNNYDIVSGRHRIFIAQESGNDYIPALVREKVANQGDG